MATSKQTKQLKQEDTQARKIWDKIKNIDLGLFALPDQFVSKCVAMDGDVPSSISASDSELHLILTVDAALPQLEECVASVRWSDNEKLVVQQKENTKFVVVKVQQK